MAKILSPYIDRCMFSFVEMYKKTESNMLELIPLSEQDMDTLAKRQGCHCIESRDIGVYDTCMNGCKYCYANKNPQKAFENYKYHNKTSLLLLGVGKPDDRFIQGAQKSFQKEKK